LKYPKKEFKISHMLKAHKDQLEQDLPYWVSNTLKKKINMHFDQDIEVKKIKATTFIYEECEERIWNSSHVKDAQRSIIAKFSILSV